MAEKKRLGWIEFILDITEDVVDSILNGTYEEIVDDLED